MSVNQSQGSRAVMGARGTISARRLAAVFRRVREHAVGIPPRSLLLSDVLQIVHRVIATFLIIEEKSLPRF